MFISDALSLILFSINFISMGLALSGFSQGLIMAFHEFGLSTTCSVPLQVVFAFVAFIISIRAAYLAFRYVVKSEYCPQKSSKLLTIATIIEIVIVFVVMIFYNFNHLVPVVTEVYGWNCIFSSALSLLSVRLGALNTQSKNQMQQKARYESSSSSSSSAVKFFVQTILTIINLILISLLLLQAVPLTLQQPGAFDSLEGQCAFSDYDITVVFPHNDGESTSYVYGSVMFWEYQNLVLAQTPEEVDTSVDQDLPCTILVFHDWTMDGSSMRPLTLLLQDNTRCSVLTPDRPGHGESSAPARPFTAKEEAEEFKTSFTEVISRADPPINSLGRVHCIGHGSGADVCLALSTQDIGFTVDSQLLFDWSGPRSAAAAWAGRRLGGDGLTFLDTLHDDSGEWDFNRFIAPVGLRFDAVRYRPNGDVCEEASQKMTWSQRTNRMPEAVYFGIHDRVNTTVMLDDTIVPCPPRSLDTVVYSAVLASEDVEPIFGPSWLTNTWPEYLPLLIDIANDASMMGIRDGVSGTCDGIKPSDLWNDPKALVQCTVVAEWLDHVVSYV
eukprot:gnl/Dysnectes_brevis/5904_a8785_533.p1 GENE.gnl/Dysnectes_brevis/5904_a8785_533~~gnl/Dysnectes_brevis/5904_a8785_533.p1  ORF type:complete len:555 (-),score=80.98 gnl/Dysnectes_brevis/5904_a8785_533:105-1769(-)